MHDHIDWQYSITIGSKRINGNRRNHYFHFTLVFIIAIMVLILPVQRYHQSTARITNISLFRIVHAWTIVTKTSRKNHSFSNQYSPTTTTATTAYHIPNYSSRRCVVNRLHQFNRYSDGDMNASQQIAQRQYYGRNVFIRSRFDRKTTTTTRHRIPVRLFATNEININQPDDDDDDVTDDRDLYEYDETESLQWVTPTSIDIPEDRVGMKFVRSSGAGGQNVNKVSSCVQIRFHVLSADWMGPLEVRQRFFQQYRNSISKHDGVYHLESQAYRTQSDNRKDVFKKLEAAILQVWPRPKERKLRVGLSERGKQKRKEDKLKQSSKKEGRRNQRFDF
jgi:RF-1 domain